MISRALLGVVIAVLLFFMVGSFLPSEARVERTIDIQRPPHTVFTLLDRFGAFAAWSPWSRRDPGTEYRFSGPASGAGARMSWKGDPRRVGSGWMEIIERQPDFLVRYRLMLEQHGEAESAFRIERIAGGARVTCSLHVDLLAGHGLFGGMVSRYFGLFLEPWIGGDLEAGLAGLGHYADSLPGADFTGLDVEFLEVESRDLLYVTVRSDGVTLAAAYREISTFMNGQGLSMSAQPMALTRYRDGAAVLFEAAIPVERRDLPTPGNVQWGRSPSGPAVRVVHRGPHEDLVRSTDKLLAWLAAHGYRKGDASWEHYISDPGETPADRLITHIYFLLGQDA